MRGISALRFTRLPLLLASPAILLAPAICSPAAFAQEAGQHVAGRDQETGKREGLDISISGVVRPRYETLSHPLSAGATGSEDLFSLRSALRLDAAAGAFSATLEGLDSRRLASDDNPDGSASSQLNAAELLQASLTWAPEDVFTPGDDLRVTLGRTTIDLGSRRLIARSNFSSVPTSFDGLDVAWTSPSGFEVRALTVNPVSRRPSDDGSLLDNEIALDSRLDNIRLSALWGDMPLPGSMTAEIGYYLLDEDDGSDVRTRNRHLDTWSARLKRKPGAGSVDFDIEGALQTGEVRASASATDITDLSKDSRMLHAEVGYTLSSRLVRVSAHYDFASGDDSAGDGDDNRFDPLFGDRSFELGPTSMFGAVARTNLQSAAIRAEISPPGLWDGLVSLRTVRLESATDSFGGSGLRDASGASGSDAGEQIEWLIRRWLVKDVARLAVGGAIFLRGDFLRDVAGGPSGDPAYTYADLTWTF